MKRWNEEMVWAFGQSDRITILRMLNAGFPHNFPLRWKDRTTGAVTLSRTFCTHLATEFGFTDILDALQDAGANWELKDSKGRTPLLVAAEAGQLFCLKNLVTKYLADPSARDYEANTALHLAAIAGHLPVVQYLIGTLAFPHQIPNADGLTALMACEKKQEHAHMQEQLTLGAVVVFLSSIKQAGTAVKPNISLFSPVKPEASPSVHRRCVNQFKQVAWAKEQGLPVEDPHRGSSLGRKVTFQLVAKDSLGPLQPLRHVSPGAVDRMIKLRCDQIYDRFVNNHIVYVSGSPQKKSCFNQTFIHRSTADSELSRYSMKAKSVT